MTFGLFAPADGTLAARSRDYGTSLWQLSVRLTGFWCARKGRDFRNWPITPSPPQSAFPLLEKADVAADLAEPYRITRCRHVAIRYWITSSARKRIDCGTTRPSASAVLLLITNSNRVGSMTGKSAG